MRTSFSLLARETPRTCAVSAGEAKSVVMTALAIAPPTTTDYHRFPDLNTANLTCGRFGPWHYISALEPSTCKVRAGYDGLEFRLSDSLIF